MSRSQPDPRLHCFPGLSSTPSAVIFPGLYPVLLSRLFAKYCRYARPGTVHALSASCLSP